MFLRSSRATGRRLRRGAARSMLRCPRAWTTTLRKKLPRRACVGAAGTGKLATHRHPTTSEDNMGLARDLTMGPKRPRGKKAGTGGPWTILRRLTAKPGPLTPAELADLRAASETVGTPGFGGRGLRTAELDYW